MAAKVGDAGGPKRVGSGGVPPKRMARARAWAGERWQERPFSLGRFQKKENIKAMAKAEADAKIASRKEGAQKTTTESHSTTVVGGADREFATWLVQGITEDVLNQDVRKMVLDPRFLATLFSKTAMTGDDAGISLKVDGETLQPVAVGEPYMTSRGEIIPVKTAAEFEDDPKQREYDPVAAKDMAGYRQSLGNKIFAQSIRERYNEDPNSVTPEEMMFMNRESPLQEEDNVWTADLNDHVLTILLTTMTRLDESVGWDPSKGETGQNPQNVFFSALEHWAETMHPDQKGRYIASVLHGFAKDRNTLADETSRSGQKIMEHNTVRDYIKGKIDDQQKFAREAAEEIAYQVLITPKDREVTFDFTTPSGKTVKGKLGVPGLGLDPETRKKLKVKEEELRRINAKELPATNKAEVVKEVAELDATMRRAKDVATYVLQTLLNIDESLPEHLAKNPQKFCGEVNRNQVLASILAEIDLLVAAREEADKYRPKSEGPKVKKRVVETIPQRPDPNTKEPLEPIVRREEEVEPGDEEPVSPVYEKRKTVLNKGKEKLDSRIDRVDLPLELKEELKALVKAIGDPEQKLEKLKVHVESEKSMLMLALNPMRAVALKVGEKMDYTWHILNAVYEGGLTRQMAPTIPLNTMGPFKMAMRWLWKRVDAMHIYKGWDLAKRKVKKLFAMLDDGMIHRMPLKLERNEHGDLVTVEPGDSRYERFARLFRKIGYVALWPYGSALLRRWRNSDDEKGRVEFKWKLLRGATMAVLGPTFLWSIVHGTLGSEAYGWRASVDEQENLTTGRRMIRRALDHGFGVKKALVAALVLTPLVGVPAIGVTGSVLTGMHATISGWFGSPRVAYRETRLRRVDEGTRLGGLEGATSDFWHADSFFHDSVGEMLQGFPSGYLTLPVPGGFDFGWPLGWLTNEVGLSGPGRPDLTDTSETIAYFRSGGEAGDRLRQDLIRLPYGEFVAYMRVLDPQISEETAQILRRNPELLQAYIDMHSGGFLMLEETNAPADEGRGGSKNRPTKSGGHRE